MPHLTVLLDLDPAVGLARAGARSRPDRLEGASAQFHEAVRAGFLALAAAEPARYAVLDAGPPGRRDRGGRAGRADAAAGLNDDLSASRDMGR